MKRSILVALCLVALVGLFSSCSSRAYAAGSASATFYLQTNQFTYNPGCPASNNGPVDGLNTSVPPSDLVFSGLYLLCSNTAYSGPEISVSSVNLTLYLIHEPGIASGNLTEYTPGGSELIYSFQNQPVVAGATSCQKFSINSTSTPQGIAPPFGTLYPGYYFMAVINFTSLPPPTEPSMCTGQGSPASIQLFGSSAIPTPEFPLGTALSIIAPLLAVATYAVAFRCRGNRGS